DFSSLSIEPDELGCSSDLASSKRDRSSGRRGDSPKIELPIGITEAIGHPEGFTRNGESRGIERLSEQRSLTNEQDVIRGPNSAAIRIEEALRLASIKGTDVDATHLGCPEHLIEVVTTVGQKVWDHVSRFPGGEPCDIERFIVGDSRKPAYRPNDRTGKENHIVVIPRRGNADADPNVDRKIANRSIREVEALQVVAHHKPDRSAIRRPEWGPR